MYPITALLTMAGAAAALTFNGTGQILAYSSTIGSNTEEGCISDAGLWSIAGADCGTFIGTRDEDSIYFTIASLDGPCELDDSVLTCGENVTATTFWAWEGLLSTTDVLAHSESFTFSSQTNASEDDPTAVRTYRTTDPKPWIWMGWSAL